MDRNQSRIVMAIALVAMIGMVAVAFLLPR